MHQIEKKYEILEIEFKELEEKYEKISAEKENLIKENMDIRKKYSSANIDTNSKCSCTKEAQQDKLIQYPRTERSIFNLTGMAYMGVIDGKTVYNKFFGDILRYKQDTAVPK